MIVPSALQKGDRVGIVCTARSYSKEALQPAIQWLESIGLVPILGETIGVEHHQFGGSDTLRAKDLQQMINREDIRAIWIARGGYGTVRIVDTIDFSPLHTHPKWLIGFSDITVLHSALHQLGLCSLHAIMPVSVPNATILAKKTLAKALFHQKFDYQFPTAKESRLGTVQGTIIGGNLSILYSLLGSKTSIDTTNTILFIEELDEYLYHIDRMFQNLKRNGYFDNVKGLIIGGMTDMHDNSTPFGYTTEQIILEVLEPYNIPICFGFPAGHISDNRALIFGKKVSLQITAKKTTLTYID